MIRIKPTSKNDKIHIDFRSLPTPLVEWAGTAEQLHRIIMDATLNATREPEQEP